MIELCETPHVMASTTHSFNCKSIADLSFVQQIVLDHISEKMNSEEKAPKPSGPKGCLISRMRDDDRKIRNNVSMDMGLDLLSYSRISDAVLSALPHGPRARERLANNELSFGRLSLWCLSLKKLPSLIHNIPLEHLNSTPTNTTDAKCIRCAAVTSYGEVDACTQCGTALKSPCLVRHMSPTETLLAGQSGVTGPSTSSIALGNIQPTTKTKEPESSAVAKQAYISQRKSHFRNAISAYSGRSTKTIPPHVIQYVKTRLESDPRTRNQPENITPAHISYLIRTCGRFSKYYRVVRQIFCMVTNRAIPSISHLETELLLMFGTGLFFLCHTGK